MNTQVERRGRGAGARKRAAQSRPTAAPDDARHELDVVRMATAEALARNAGRRAMIAEAAYYRAEKRGFEPGHEAEDWLAAEAQIVHALSLSGLSPAEPPQSRSTP